MIARLRHAWSSWPRRYRLVAVTLAVVLVAGLYIFLVRVGQDSHSRLQANVALLRAQALEVAQQAAEIERLRLAPIPPAVSADIKGLVGGLLVASGISHAVERMDASDEGRVVVVFGTVGFAEWLRWIDSLAAHQLRLDACRIEALSVSGTVGVTATLVRARPS